MAAYTTRVLPREEWPRLVGTEVEPVWPHLDDRASVVVVERDGAIVGTWVVLPLVHLECAWIAPTERRAAAVSRRLLRGVRDVLCGLGVRSVLTAAIDDHVRAVIDKLGGVPCPGDVYAIPVERLGGRSCQQHS